MTPPLQLSEEMSAGPARLRIDVHGSRPIDHVLDDMSFLNYRLADVRVSQRSQRDRDRRATRAATCCRSL